VAQNLAMSEAWIERARAMPIEAGLLGRTVPWKGGGRGVDRCGPCPSCAGDDRFSINTARNVWNCRGCAKGGNVIALAMHVAGVKFFEAVEMLTGEPPPRQESVRQLTDYPARTLPPETSRRRETIPHPSALAIWHKAGNPRGTIVERYLASRRCELPYGSALRFHPSCPWKDDETGEVLRVPAMIALRRSIWTDKPISIHRTRLSPEGIKIDRRGKGAAGGTAIKIDADAEVAMGLTIGEGIETCLAGRQLGFRPTWALGDANGIKAFPVLPGIEALTILAEQCPVNAGAIQACGERWMAAGREVIVVRPRIGKDVNDALREAA
jgi:hypothetical protein